jgi:hypothetical protein
VSTSLNCSHKRTYCSFPRRCMSMENRGGMIPKGENRRTRRKYLSQCQCFHHKSHMEWSRHQAGPPWWEASDQLPQTQHGPACYLSFTLTKQYKSYEMCARRTPGSDLWSLWILPWVNYLCMGVESGACRLGDDVTTGIPTRLRFSTKRFPTQVISGLTMHVYLHAKWTLLLSDIHQNSNVLTQF